VRGENRRRGEGIWLVTYDGDWRETFRPDIPSVARIYDYLLGGKDNYPADPAVRELIDFDEPVALLFLSLLHFVADEADPAGIIAKLLAPFPAGSYVAISHATPDEVPEVNDVERVFDEATTSAHVRSRAEIRRLVAGMEIIEPGLAWPPEWRPDPGEEIPANAAESYYCVVVARTT
jgi:hypothetical protein